MQDVIFAGTRERKPLGMAEVTLTLVDPEVYGDAVEPEIEIQDDMPEAEWDEPSLRAAAATEAEHYIEEVRPGQGDEEARRAERKLHAEATVEASAAAAAPQQVVLKIRRRKFKRTFKAGEIAVTRRLFRSGESEYLLNGKLCRLRDIQDIFMGTGLGPESYAIIEQGRIGQILSSKPTDRRAIIEEAAGITKFKTRKRLAEARLEDAKLNLSRINDIFDEVTRQMNSLKRQASKAERYAQAARRNARQAARGAGQQVRATRRRSARHWKRSSPSLANEMHAKGEAVQAMEAEHGERTQRGYAIEREGNENREKLNTLVMEIDRAVARRRTNEERCAELDARSRRRAGRSGWHRRATGAPAAGAAKRTAASWSRPMPTSLWRRKSCSSGSRRPSAHRETLMDCRTPAGAAARGDPAGGLGGVVGAQPHHAGRGAHCRAGPRGAAAGGRNQDREPATGEFRRTARAAGLGV